MKPEPFICHEINATNASVFELDYTLADTGTVVAGVLIFLLILPLVLFEFPFFPLGTTPAILLGAVLMVCTTVLSQEDAYRHIGEPGNLRTIFLLLGMMLLAQYFEREKIINRMISRLLKDNISFASYLWRICLATSVVSAIITNDAACVVLTPLWLENWKKQNRPQVELETLLLAIATSANIGSAVTIFGNPQMALIASKTNVPHFRESRLDLLRCITFIGIPTIVGSLLNICFLIIHWKIRSRGSDKEKGNKVSANHEHEMAFIESKSMAVDLVSSDQNSCHSATENQDKHMDRNRISSSQRPIPFEDAAQDCDVYYSTQHYLEDIEPGKIPVAERVNKASLSNFHEYAKSLSNLGPSFQHHNHDRVSIENILMYNKNKTEQPETLYHNGRSNTSISLKYDIETLEHQKEEQHSDKTKILDPSELLVSTKLRITRSIQSLTVPAVQVFEKPGVEVDMDRLVDFEFKASESRAFHICLWISLLVLVALLFVDTDAIHFDMGLLPMAIATFLMLVDAFWNKRNALFIIRRLDWSVFIMFLGLFVWMAGLNATRIPRWMWKTMGLADSQFNSFSSLTILCVFIVVCSNIFSNVPLAIIVLQQLQPCTNQLPLVLYLAWCSTIAGNLTLFGSVANLIVAQKCKTALGYQFSYWAYFKYGFVTTCVIVVVGVAILNGMLQVVGKV